MPFCEDCDRYWSPNSMAPDGSCPRCGEVIADTPPSGGSRHGEDDDGSWPWHFWLLVSVTAAYLLWRVIQGIGGLFS